jgi:hypothetical protein
VALRFNMASVNSFMRQATYEMPPRDPTTMMMRQSTKMRGENQAEEPAGVRELDEPFFEEAVSWPER